MLLQFEELDSYDRLWKCVSDGKETAVQETQVQSLGREDPLEEGTANHSSTLACRIPRTEESGRLQSLGLC